MWKFGAILRWTDLISFIKCLFFVSVYVGMLESCGSGGSWWTFAPPPHLFVLCFHCVCFRCAFSQKVCCQTWCPTPCGCWSRPTRRASATPPSSSPSRSPSGPCWSSLISRTACADSSIWWLQNHTSSVLLFQFSSFNKDGIVSKIMRETAFSVMLLSPEWLLKLAKKKLNWVKS